MTALLGTVLVFALSYLLGSCPSGYLLGKLNGIDIRKYGSHNIGATNVRRVLGRPWSILCFLMDFFKGMIPVLVFGHSLGGSLAIGPNWGAVVAAIAAVLGHVFPAWLKFKGGKGVATSLGAAAGIAFVPVLIGGVTWYVVFNMKRIVSLASMAAVVVIALVAMLARITHVSYYGWPEILLLCIIAALVVIRHKDNIKRLREGSESVFAKNTPENK